MLLDDWKIPPAPLPTSQIIIDQPTEIAAANRPTEALDTRRRTPIPTWIQAVPSAKAIGCEFQMLMPCSINACSHAGVLAIAGATTPFASPSGIDDWNC